MDMLKCFNGGLDDETQERDSLDIDLRELRHRLKNFMAVVQAMSRQSMQKSATIAEFDAAFTARLDAYGRTMDELVARRWRGLDIHALVRLQLAPFGLDDGRISAVGPPLMLRSESAHALGLALHELATNAVKYGALSVPKGRGLFSWTVSETKPRRVDFMWQEVGGPAVELPLRRGFGTQVIQRTTTMLLGGEATQEFRPDGVVWRLSCDPAAITVPQVVAPRR